MLSLSLTHTHELSLYLPLIDARVRGVPEHEGSEREDPRFVHVCFRVEGSEFRVQGSRFGVQGPGFGVEGKGKIHVLYTSASGFIVWGLG